MGSLTLYTTLGCHLCQHAEALLEAAGCQFVTSDIAEDLTLLERYGTRIPVVRDSLGSELGWPFDGTKLSKFMNKKVNLFLFVKASECLEESSFSRL